MVSSNEEDFAIDLVFQLTVQDCTKNCSMGAQLIKLGHLYFRMGVQDNEDKDLRPFLLELVAHCPEEASIDSSLQRELITKLNLSFCYSLSNVDGLSNPYQS